MAVKDINDKSDGIYDSLLPETVLKTTIHDTHERYNLGIQSGYAMLSIDNGTGVHAVIGPDVARVVAGNLILPSLSSFSLLFYLQALLLSYSKTGAFLLFLTLNELPRLASIPQRFSHRSRHLH